MTQQEIVGYRLKPSIDRMMVDGILKNAMPVWNDEDKSVYFIKGHVVGSLVAKMKELQVLDLWFTPIYEEVKSDWAKEHHLEYYHKEGIMKAKQETLNVKQNTHYVDFSNPNADKLSSASTTSMKQETLEEAADKYTPLKIEQKAFIAGAKWQQEQEKRYSEEEVNVLLDRLLDNNMCSVLGDALIQQFKKK
jgi:hypothetical protein